MFAVIKVGDVIYCNCDIKMDGSGEVKCRKGKYYTIINSYYGSFEILNDDRECHTFDSIGNRYDSSRWFSVVDKLTPRMTLKRVSLVVV